MLVFDRRLVQTTLRLPLRMFYGNRVESKYISGQHKCCIVSLDSVKCCSEGVSAHCWNRRLNNGFVMAVLIYRRVFSHSLCPIYVALHCTDVEVASVLRLVLKINIEDFCFFKLTSLFLKIV